MTSGGEGANGTTSGESSQDGAVAAVPQAPSRLAAAPATRSH
ncbi:MAG: hypothetical protein QOI06_68 [Nocardioidaceae bacterium]|jgi:hypothetical protein|nr:hypothetical protein [Nocardioidaceae bacterium]